MEDLLQRAGRRRADLHARRRRRLPDELLRLPVAAGMARRSGNRLLRRCGLSADDFREERRSEGG